MAIIVGDVIDLQQRHHPWNVPRLIDEEGFSQPPPPDLVPQ